ncbi:MAG: hypothetical protein KA773_23230 [Chloroflexi bacterium]|nr:hypothetical protein [Chloroflexota bacterium]
MWLNQFDTERLANLLLSFFEPLPVDDMPYCCYRSTEVLYQRPSVVGDSGSYVPHDQVQSRWNLMGERWTDESIEFAALASFVQHDGRVYELVSGRVNLA